MSRRRFLTVYEHLLRHHGPQRWWPGETPFEIMVGAVLTQNTAWTNVEKAVANLKAHDLLDPERMVSVPVRRLATRIKPAGYFNVKAERLRNVCRWYLDRGGHTRLSRWRTDRLRESLLSVNGVGPETADDILLYAFHRDVFVIDAYTRRLFSRLGLVEAGHGYEDMRRRFESQIRRERSAADGPGRSPRVHKKALAGIFNEYHALIVNHGKDVCKVRPRCGECCLRRHCPAADAGSITRPVRRGPTSSC